MELGLVKIQGKQYNSHNKVHVPHIYPFNLRKSEPKIFFWMFKFKCFENLNKGIGISDKCLFVSSITFVYQRLKIKKV